MDIAIVGAGPAGLTAAYRLHRTGHAVTILEERGVAGGRTHTEHLGPDHWLDTGAGWLASFYPDTLRLLDELDLRGRLGVLPIRGGGDLRIEGRLVPMPNSVRRLLATDLLSAREKVRFFAWMAELFVRQRGALRIDRRWDGVTALDALQPAGRRAREAVVRATFEGPFFSRLEELSGALLRSWLRELSVGTFYQVDGGMDAPWRHLGVRLGARTGHRVERIAVDGTSGRVRVVVDGGAGGGEETFDGVVVAVPAPIARRIVDPAFAPPILDGIRYAPHVRVSASHPGALGWRSGIHAFPNELVATVELGGGRFGGWGRVPADRTWALVCAPAATSGPLIEAPGDEVIERLWAEASRIDPRLFPIAGADVVRLVRWPQAVPVVEPGYHARLAGFRQAPPVVFAGDWLVQPCVEGAVRSGEAAARLFGAA